MLIVLALVGVAVYQFGVPKLPWATSTPPAPAPTTIPVPQRSSGHLPPKVVPKPAPIVATKPADPTRDQKLAAVRKSPAWIEAKRQADALEMKLNVARHNGDQQAITAASFKWIEAKDKVGEIEQAALEAQK